MSYSSLMNRRRFLAATAASLGSSVAGAGSSHPHISAPSEDWLDRVQHSKAALFLDVTSFSQTLTHFDRATAYLEGEAGRRSGAVVVVGLHGAGLAHGLSNRLWADWNISNQLGVVLADAQKAEGQFRGWLLEMAGNFPGSFMVLACQRTLRRWATAQNPSSPATEVAKAREQVIPGVSLVPAMITASAHAQHAGSAYVVSAS